MTPNPDNRAANSAEHRVMPLWLQRLCAAAIASVLALNHVLNLSSTNGELMTFPAPHLPPMLEKFDYSKIEFAFTRLAFDSAGKLVIDSNTQASLNDAAEQMPNNAPEVLQRLGFLIHMQMPVEHAQQVEALFRPYLSYYFSQQAINARFAKPNNLQQEIEQFEQLVALQDQVLGLKLADQLFGDYRKLSRFMFASRQLETNSALSADKRQQQLRELQAAIYASGADGE